MRGIYKADSTRSRKFAQVIELFAVLVEFGRVSTTELFPARWLVSEPLPEFGTGRDILGPLIDLCRLFLHAARPQPVDQDTRTILRGRALIGALQPDSHRRNLLVH